jgi:threonine/homoserine efflux transporter RhtA
MLLGNMIFYYLGASFRKKQAEGRAAPGSAALRFFTAQGTGAVKEPSPLHPMARKNERQ